MSEALSFVVEEAGCESCATRVRAAIEQLAPIERIEVDHDTELATVRVAVGTDLSEEAVNKALEQASEGTGHTYRVQRGSWSAAA